MQLKTICQYVALTPLGVLLSACSLTATTALLVDDQPIGKGAQYSLLVQPEAASVPLEKPQRLRKKACLRTSHFFGEDPVTGKMTVDLGDYLRAQLLDWSQDSDCR